MKLKLRRDNKEADWKTNNPFAKLPRDCKPNHSYKLGDKIKFKEDSYRDQFPAFKGRNVILEVIGFYKEISLLIVEVGKTYKDKMIISNKHFVRVA